MKNKIKICRIVSVPFFFRNHLVSSLIAAIKQGYELHIVCSPGPDIRALSKITGLIIHEIEIRRDISLIDDIKSLIAIYKLFRKHHFLIIHSTTPKAGLLNAIAGFLAGIPIRFHTFTGQLWFYRTGFSQKVLKLCDWLIVKLNTRCYADSFSQKEFLVSEKIGTSSNIQVIGKGSLAGVNSEVYDPEKFNKKIKDTIRKELSIPSDATIINFTGRINLDKGFREYIKAFNGLYKLNKSIYWIIIGPYDKGKLALPQKMIDTLNRHPNIRLLGYCPSPVKYYAVSDIFCIPSYREGFGNVVIEAGIMGVPSVATNIVGLKDSVADGYTGILVPVKEAKLLQAALNRIIGDKNLRQRLGENAKMRAHANFEQDTINRLILKEYETFLNPLFRKEAAYQKNQP